MVMSSLQSLKKRLPGAIRASRDRQGGYRKKVKSVIDQFIGPSYVEDSKFGRMPVNMMKLQHDITRRQLVARTPRVRIETDHPELKPSAYELELAMDFLLGKIGFGRTMRKIVQDAFFGVGIAKTGICGDYGLMYGSRAHFTGVPFFDRVALDDWVHDAKARTWEEITFCGNSYLENAWSLEASGMFEGKELKKLTVKHDEHLTDDGERRTSAAGSGQRMGDPDIVDFYEFWDIWIPAEGKILTMQLDGEVLREVDWNGPPNGPYDLLGFGDVPDNILPLSPGAAMYDLHTLVNELYRKVGRQALRQKTITLVRRGADEDGKRIRDADDGEMIGVDNPQDVNEVQWGGADQVTLATAIHCADRYSYQAGNLDSMGGLSPQAGTLGQEELLAESSSKLIQDLQDSTIEFTERRTRDLAWFMWSDPEVEIPIVKRGSDGFQMPITFDHSRKSGDFFDYNIGVHPYSMKYVSPAQQMQIVNAAVDKAAMLGPILMQNGQTIDTVKLFEEWARSYEVPVLNEIITYVGQSMHEPVGSEAMMDLKPANTKRTYERVNRPGASRGQKDQAMVSHLLGSGIQPKEQTTARTTG